MNVIFHAGRFLRPFCRPEPFSGGVPAGKPPQQNRRSPGAVCRTL